MKRESDLILTHIRFTKNQKSALEAVARRKGCSVTALNRKIVEEYFKGHPEYKGCIKEYASN